MSVKIGLMSFAHMHMGSYASAVNEIPEAEMVGIADHDFERAKQMAETFDSKAFASYEELLKQDIDAVIIASENIHHKELTTLAAEAGKHVLCEKPIATTIANAQAMIDVCKKNNVQLMTAFPCRFSPAMVRVKEIVEAGTIGEILAVKGTNQGRMPGGWFIEKDKSGGGAVIDHTVHVTDLMRWMLNSEATEVYAEISNRVHHGDYDDVGQLTITFGNGVFTSLNTSWSRPKSFPTWGDVTMEITGTNGVVSMNMFSQDIHLYSDETMSTSWAGWGSNTDLLMVQDFVTRIANGEPVSITGEDGLRAVEVALGAYRSFELGEAVKLPLE